MVKKHIHALRHHIIDIYETNQCNSRNNCILVNIYKMFYFSPNTFNIFRVMDVIRCSFEKKNSKLEIWLQIVFLSL